MKVGTVPASDLSASKGLRASDYLYVDRWEDRDVTVRITGEAARYLRRQLIKTNVPMRTTAEDIILNHARRQDGND